jgi:hypothetical protein
MSVTDAVLSALAILASVSRPAHAAQKPVTKALAISVAPPK